MKSTTAPLPAHWHRPRSAADIVAGLFFVTLAAATWWFSAGLPVGRAMRMGPAYVPLVVAGALGVLGTALMARALAGFGPRLEPWAWRPLVIVLASILAFALLIRPAGLAVATVALVPLASGGVRGGRWREIALLTVALATFSVALFCYLLRLPIRPWP